MADFTSNGWSWFVGITTIISIVVIILLVKKITSGEHKSVRTTVETMGHVWDESLAEYNNPMPRWWLNLFYITLFWGLGYLLFYPGLGAFKGLLGWSQIEQYDNELAAAEADYGPLFAQFQQMPIADLAGNDEAVKIGERLFATYCAACHGSDARGARGFPNLRDDDWLYGGEPEQIVAAITNGRSGVMPAWGAILDAEKIAAVSAYVEQLAGREVEAKLAAAGKAVYDVNCFACHGSDGGGNVMLGAPRFNDDIWLYGGTSNKISESISAGRNGIMPPHGEFLGPAKVHLLGTYVYQLRSRE